jgi:uncharacterized damage-inducible protein DinB
MEIKKDKIEAVEGFAREIGHYLAAWERGREQTRELISDLTPAELATRISLQMHSIGALALHLGETEFYWLQMIVARRAATEEEKKAAHFCDTLESDTDKGYTAEYCLATLDRTSEMSRALLLTKTDAELETMHLRDDYGEPGEYSLRSLLVRMIDHEAHHRGQIAMIKRLLRGGETATK